MTAIITIKHFIYCDKLYCSNCDYIDYERGDNPFCTLFQEFSKWSCKTTDAHAMRLKKCLEATNV